MVQPALRRIQMPEIPKPQSLAERIEAEVPAATKPELTVSSMAERFAPDAMRATRAEPGGPPTGDAALNNSSAGARRSALPPRGVVVVLTVVAIAPAAILAGLLWLGAIRGPDGAFDFGGRPASPSLEARAAASMAATPLPRPTRPAQPVPAIALSAPEELAAKAGEAVGFAMAIDAAPERSVIVIRDLPKGATFSQGRPYGANEWSLRPDEIAGLMLHLPEDQPGLSDIRVELVGADGTVLAHAATRLEIAPAPRAGLVIRSDEADRVETLMVNGHKMMAVGYFAGARAYFGRAAEAGSGEAALAIGATFDPAVIAGIGAHGIKPDVTAARDWYDRAAGLGLTDRDAKLAGLRRDWSQGRPPAKSHLAKSGPGTSDAAIAPPKETAAAPAETPDDPRDDERPGPLGRLVAAASELTSSEEWLQTVGAVNMRAEPSSTAETRKIAPKGRKLRVLGREGNWVQVADPVTKDEGWIYARFLTGID